MPVFFTTITLVALAIWLCVKCFELENQRLEDHYGFSKQSNISETEYCDLMPNISRNTALKVREILIDTTGWEAAGRQKKFIRKLG